VQPALRGHHHCSIAENSVYFVANTQLRKHALGAAPAQAFNPLRILRVPLAPFREH
jgi:hypothetical protein